MYFDDLERDLTIFSLLYDPRAFAVMAMSVAAIIGLYRYLIGCALEHCSKWHENCQYRKLVTISDPLCYTTRICHHVNLLEYCNISMDSL